MRVLFVEGKDGDALRALARKLPHPYRLLYRQEQELYLLEVWACPPEVEAEVAHLPDVRAWSFELMEEGQGQRS